MSAATHQVETVDLASPPHFLSLPHDLWDLWAQAH